MNLINALLRHAAISNANNPRLFAFLQWVIHHGLFRIKLRFLIMILVLFTVVLLSVLPGIRTFPKFLIGVPDEIDVIDEFIKKEDSRILAGLSAKKRRLVAVSDQHHSNKGFQGLVKSVYKPGFSVMPRNPTLCSPANPNEKKEVFLLIMIFSAPGNQLHRRAIRETWGNLASFPTVKLAFVVGQTDSFHQSVINHEAEAYNDVVQGLFFDNYENLPLKTVAILDWASTYCKQAEFVVKMDDDVLMNVDLMLRSLRQHDPSKPAIFGHYRERVKPERNANDPMYAKYFVPFEEYPDKYYPVYCSGPTYVITGNLARPLFDETLKSKYFKLEDILVTGIVAKRLGVKCVSMPGIYNDLPPKKLDDSLRSAVAYFTKSPCNMYRYWGLQLTRKSVTEKVVKSYESYPVIRGPYPLPRVRR